MIPDYNPYFMFFPVLPLNCSKPPTLYSILNSIVNGEKDEEDYTKIKNLAKEGRSIIFNFYYPLTNNITKEKFETMILNKFLTRRINFDTLYIFRMKLDVKLNEIMPRYNKLFDSLENWDIFNDGEVVTETGRDTKTSNQTGKTTNESRQTENTTNESSQTGNTTNETTQNTSSENSIETSSETSASSTNDRRYSDTPQDQLTNVQNGTYLTDYTYDQNSSSGEDSSNSSGTSSSENSTNSEENKIQNINSEENRTQNINSEENRTQNQNDSSNYEKKILRSPADKIAIYKEMQDSIKSIYTMIFDDLEVLFYGIL